MACTKLRTHAALWAVLVWFSATSSFGEEAAAPGGVDRGKDAEAADRSEGWRPLFDGQSLKGWKKTDFAGGSEPKVEDGLLILPYGEMLSGATWEGDPGDFPKTNYEIRLEAQRVDGSDFFCGLTFPVGEEHCSLIVGGWGGAIVGLSCIDGYDASENVTTVFEKYENKKWYPIRVRVTDDAIEAWIDDRRLVNIERAGKEFSVRWEVEASRPLGLATYQSTAAIRNLEFRELDAALEQPGEQPANGD
jgi:hypothetical protein